MQTVRANMHNFYRPSATSLHFKHAKVGKSCQVFLDTTSKRKSRCWTCDKTELTHLAKRFLVSVHWVYHYQ